MAPSARFPCAHTGHVPTDRPKVLATAAVTCHGTRLRPAVNKSERQETCVPVIIHQLLAKNVFSEVSELPTLND